VFKKLLALLAAAAIAALALLAGRASAIHGSVVADGYRSVALGGRLPFAIYLPPDYTTSGKRYPVVYFLHGLPASPEAYRGIGYVTEALEQSGREALVVAPRGTLADGDDDEYLDRGAGRNWESALARELPAYVDAHYRTIATRTGRALVGVSAGGYGAMLLALHHLDAFAAVESWSGYFHPTDPSGLHPLPSGPDASAHTYVRSLPALLRARPTFLGFYVGSEDARFRAENVALARELSRARVPFLFRVYPGGHAQAVWSAHAAEWLALALDHLARAA
jgi:enterochelin esterase-like enzyme